MPIEPSELRVQVPTEVVMGDRACTRCGYNVRGLRVGTRCPECGTTIGGVRRRQSRFADNLTESPLWYLLVVLGGAVGMAVALVGSLAFSVFLSAQSMSFRPLPVSVVAVGSLVCAGLWVAGVCLVTLKRPESEHVLRDPVLDSDPLRWAARLGQGVFLGAVVTRYAATTSGSAGLDTAASVLEYVTLLALAPLCVYLGSLSDWAGDTGGGERLRSAAWAFVVAGSGALVFGLLMATPVPFKILLVVGFVLCVIGVLVGVFLFVASVLVLANTSAWAVFNADQSRKREARIAERKRRQLEKEAGEAARRDAVAEAQASAVERLNPGPRPAGSSERGGDGDEIDRRLGGLSPSAVSGPEGVRLPGEPTSIDPRRVRHSSERVIDPGGTGGYELEPEDDGDRR